MINTNEIDRWLDKAVKLESEGKTKLAEAALRKALQAEENANV